MSLELYRNLSWLPAPPVDFTARCKKLLDSGTGFGTETRALATHALDEHQLARLGRAIEAGRSKGHPLAPLTPFRLGLLGNGTLDLIVPVLVATAARHGIALECIRGGYDQFLQDALLPESGINQARPDAVLLALDYRGLSIQATPGDPGAAEQTVDAAASLLFFQCGKNAPKVVEKYRQKLKKLNILSKFFNGRPRSQTPAEPIGDEQHLPRGKQQHRPARTTMGMMPIAVWHAVIRRWPAG